MGNLQAKIAVPFEISRQLRREYLSREQLASLQWRKLQCLLRFAYDHVPFYRRRFQAIGAGPEDIRTPGDFASFPILTRDDVLYHVEEMLAYPLETLHRGNSGGSTGHPLRIYTRPEYKYYLWALRKRTRRWFGADILHPYFTLWGMTAVCNVPERIGRWDRLTKRQYRYAYHGVGRQDLARLAADLVLVKPRMIFGYASLLRTLAQYLLDEAICLAKPPECIISTAETLPFENRLLIEQGLRAPVYNAYGANENGDIACECQERRGLHVLSDHIYLEIERNGQPVVPGEPGYMIITDLDNLAMPYIRYQNADIGSWSEEAACPCGRTLPMLQTVYGRHTDFVVDEVGLIYPGINLMRPLRHVADHFRQFQLLQKERGKLEVLAVPGNVMAEDDVLRVIEAMRAEFHGHMGVLLKLVEEIPSEPSGKTRFVKSNVPFSEVFGRVERQFAEDNAAVHPL